MIGRLIEGCKAGTGKIGNFQLKIGKNQRPHHDSALIKALTYKHG
jgi:hypothetical protein